MYAISAMWGQDSENIDLMPTGPFKIWTNATDQQIGLICFAW